MAGDALKRAPTAGSFRGTRRRMTYCLLGVSEKQILYARSPKPVTGFGSQASRFQPTARRYVYDVTIRTIRRPADSPSEVVDWGIAVRFDGDQLHRQANLGAARAVPQAELSLDEQRLCEFADQLSDCLFNRPGCLRKAGGSRGHAARPEPLCLLVFRRVRGHVASKRVLQLCGVSLSPGGRRVRELARGGQGSFRMVSKARTGSGRGSI